MEVAMGGQRKTLEEQEAELEQALGCTKEQLQTIRQKIKARNRTLDTRRKVLTGVCAEKESRANAEAQVLMERAIRTHIAERDKHVFPELFPDAKPPQRADHHPRDIRHERSELN
jgi:hypothetical protein